MSQQIVRNVYEPLLTEDPSLEKRFTDCNSTDYDDLASETCTDRLSIVCSIPHFLALLSVLVTAAYVVVKVRTENIRQMQDDDLARRCAFVYLTTSNATDIRNLGYSVQSLNKYLKAGMRYPIIIVHEGIAPVTQGHLQTLSEAPLSFRLTHLGSPPEMNLSRETPTFTKRTRWSYQNMIRFWFLTALHSDASKAAPFQDIDYAVRMDTDSALTGPVSHDFVKEFVASGAQYGHRGIGQDCGANMTLGLRQLAEAYVDYNGIKPSNMELWRRIGDKQGARNMCMPKFLTSFEVLNMQFFRSHSGIQDWMRVVDSSRGIYRHRWGDAVLRYLTVAIYAAPEKVVQYSAETVQYEHPHQMGKKGK